MNQLCVNAVAHASKIGGFMMERPVKRFMHGTRQCWQTTPLSLTAEVFFNCNHCQKPYTKQQFPLTRFLFIEIKIFRVIACELFVFLLLQS